MAQPLTADYKLQLQYVVGGLIHKLDAYCEASPSALFTSGYALFDRFSVASIDAGDAGQNLWSAMKYLYDDSVLPPVCTLFNRVGVVWNPVTTPTLTGSGLITPDNSNGRCGQFTMSLRSSLFHRLRLIFMEQQVVDTASKFLGAVGYPSGFSHVIATVTGTAGNAADYFNWARSRNKEILNGGAPVVSSTWDLNDKVRRARGVQ